MNVNFKKFIIRIDFLLISYMLEKIQDKLGSITMLLLKYLNSSFYIKIVHKKLDLLCITVRFFKY